MERPRVLPLKFFRRSALAVAPELLGKYLVRESGGEKFKLIITEVEAYEGEDDLASHAARGKTPRNEVMFQAGGVWYVYLCYGMHWMLNIVTGDKDYPSAALIRGVENYDGPGKLTKNFKIDRRFNAKPATPKTGLYFAENLTVKHRMSDNQLKIIQLPRVGVAYAGPIWSAKPWRFKLDI